ncbi:MAG: hypothetical protein CM1200mP4_3380 [Rhodospirillaceae bacterium]|nr:MAG: hypothetical protein CM1200mP4_3380 [Rhodospirillaceae bacterium]
MVCACGRNFGRTPIGKKSRWIAKSSHRIYKTRPICVGCLRMPIWILGKLYYFCHNRIKAVQQEAENIYMGSDAPLISVWAFQLDGFFIGATRAKEMRNAMFCPSCLPFYHTCLVPNSKTMDYGLHFLFF